MGNTGLVNTHLGFENLATNHYACFAFGCNYFLSWINGREWTHRPWVNGKLPPYNYEYHVCLLYTSPSPRD